MISDKELFKQMADRDVVNLYRYLVYQLAGGTSIFLYFRLLIVFYVLFVVENIVKHLLLVGQ